MLARTASTARPAASAVCFTGSRGTGKTVMLDLVRDRARELGFVTSEVTRFDRTSSSPQRLAAGIAEGTEAAELDDSSRWERWRHRLSQMSVEVSAGIVKVTGQLPAPEEDPGQRDNLTNLLVETASLARESGHAGLAVFVDELQEAGYPDPERSDLVVVANAVQDSLRRNAPIVFVMAGLPETPDRVMAAASFAERFDFNQLPMLTHDEASVALLQPATELGVGFAPAAADKVLEAAGGSPFLVQLYGDELWHRASPGRGSLLTAGEADDAIQNANANLSAGMFRGRWGKATDAEQTLMMAVAAVAGPDGVATTADVTAALGAADSRAWSRVRDRLIDKGLVEAPQRGRIGFTMPGFAQYVRDHHGPDPLTLSEGQGLAREDSPGQALAEDPAIPGSNAESGDQLLDLYHRTSPDAASAILNTGRFITRENTDEAYVSNRIYGEVEGYGVAVVHVKVPLSLAELDDEFPDGEQHFRIPLNGARVVDAFMLDTDNCRVALPDRSLDTSRPSSDIDFVPSKGAAAERRNPTSSKNLAGPDRHVSW